MATTYEGFGLGCVGEKDPKWIVGKRPQRGDYGGLALTACRSGLHQPLPS